MYDLLNSQYTEKKNPAPCAQTLVNPAALVEQISCIFPNPTLYFGQIPDPEKYRFQTLLWETTKTHLKN